MVKDIAKEVERIAEELGVDRKRSIGEVAHELKVKSHVIRFWEDNFSQIKPEIGAGGRRYYYNKQLKILRRIKKFLYEEGYTIAGLKKLLSGKKHEDKEEDLQILMQESAAPKQEEIIDDEPRIGIDDFIAPEVRIETGVEISEKKFLPKKIMPGSKINPEARLADFANLEVPAIDLSIKNKVQKHLKNAKNHAQKMRILLNKL